MSLHGLIYLNLWSPIGKTIWEEWGSVALLEEGFEKDPAPFLVGSLCLVVAIVTIKDSLATVPAPCLSLMPSTHTRTHTHTYLMVMDSNPLKL